MKNAIANTASTAVITGGIAVVTGGAWLASQGEFLIVTAVTALLGAAHCYGINNNHVRKPRLALWLFGAALALTAMRIAT